MSRRMWFPADRLTSSAATVLIGAVFLIAQIILKPVDFIDPDAQVYFQTANSIAEHGVFSRGDAPGIRPDPEMYLTPLYPGFLALAGMASDTVRAAIACQASGAGGCNPSDLTLVVILQSGLAILMLISIVYAAKQFFPVGPGVLIVTLLVLSTGVQARYAQRFITEPLAFVFVFGSLAMLAAALHRGQTRHWVLAGALAGLAALARPSYQVLMVMLPFIALTWHLLGPHRSLRAGGKAAALAGAAATLVILPWLVRNGVVMDRFAMSETYGGFALLSRTVYNDMTGTQVAAAFIEWFPFAGGRIAELLFPMSVLNELRMGHPDSLFAAIGTVRGKVLAEVGDIRDLSSHVFEQRVLPNLWQHLLVTLPLAFRGMWVGPYVSLLAVLLLLPAVAYLRRARMLLSFSLFLSPLVVMLGAHAFASVNVVRYNDPLLLPFSILAAAGGLYLADSVRRRRTRGD